MTINGCKLLIAVLIIAPLATPLRAEEVAVNWDGTFEKVRAHYEYNKDGVPLLGLISGGQPKSQRVKFTTCGNTTFEVDSKDLKRSPASCPSGPPGQGPWSVESKNVIYLVKGATGSLLVRPKVGGPQINLQSLPDAFKKLVAEAKPGDTVAIKYTASDGKPSIGILDSPMP